MDCFSFCGFPKKLLTLRSKRKRTMDPKPLVVCFTGAPDAEDLPAVTGGTVLDCRDMEGTNCYCDAVAEAELKRRFSAFPVRAVHWIDSGDYHYCSRIWTDRIPVPFDLVVADHHPDMQVPAFGDILSCGGWVRQALETNPNLRDVWLVGIAPGLKGECGGFGGRVHVADRDEVAQTAPEDLLRRLSGRPVYLSVDRDVLDREYARTDWDQGTMTLDWLCGLVRGLSPRLLGVDVCGNLPEEKGGREEDFSVNRRTSRRLHGLFSLSLSDAEGRPFPSEEDI